MIRRLKYCLLCASLWLVLTGQGFSPIFEREDVPGDWANADYFARDRDRTIATVVRSVGIDHLGRDNYWRRYTTGLLFEARGDLVYTLNQVPNHPKALYLLGQLSREMRDPDFAVPFFEKAIHLYPQYPYTLAQYGAFLVDTGHLNVGRQFLREALQADSTLVLAKGYLAQLSAPSRPVTKGSQKGGDSP